VIWANKLPGRNTITATAAAAGEIVYKKEEARSHPHSYTASMRNKKHESTQCLQRARACTLAHAKTAPTERERERTQQQSARF